MPHGHKNNNGHNHHTGAKKALSLRGVWDSVKGFARDNRQNLKVPLLISALMGTTALATPLINSALGAGTMLAASLYLLVKSSDAVTQNASDLGEKAGISPLMLGLGLGAMASVPELFVAVKSVISDAPEIGIGQIVGANIAHVFLILGAVAAIAPDGIKQGKGLGWKFNTLTMAGTTLGFGAALASGMLTPAMGAGMLALAGMYVGGNYLVNKKDAKMLGVPVESLIHSHAGGHCSHDHGHDHNHNHHDHVHGHDHHHSHDHHEHHHDHDHHEHHHDHEHEHEHEHHDHGKKSSPWMNGLWGTAGMAGLVYSAHMAVDSASTLAFNSGVSQATVSAVAIALGVSLPELAISANAARKNNTDMAVGNILGCNIFNILFVGSALGLAGTVVPDNFSTASTLGQFNLAALGTSAGLMSAALLAGKGEVKRWQGVASLGVYASYVATSAVLGGLKLPEVTLEDIRKEDPAPVIETVPMPPPIPKYLPAS